MTEACLGLATPGSEQDWLGCASHALYLVYRERYPDFVVPRARATEPLPGRSRSPAN